MQRSTFGTYIETIWIAGLISLAPLPSLAQPFGLEFGQSPQMVFRNVEKLDPGETKEYVRMICQQISINPDYSSLIKYGLVKRDAANSAKKIGRLVPLKMIGYFVKNRDKIKNKFGPTASIKTFPNMLFPEYIHWEVFKHQSGNAGCVHFLDNELFAVTIIEPKNQDKFEETLSNQYNAPKIYKRRVLSRCLDKKTYGSEFKCWYEVSTKEWMHPPLESLDPNKPKPETTPDIERIVSRKLTAKGVEEPAFWHGQVAVIVYTDLRRSSKQVDNILKMADFLEQNDKK